MHWFILFFLSSSGFASILHSEITRVDLAGEVLAPHLVFLSKGGLVGTLPFSDMKTMVLLTEGMKKHQIFKITMDSDRRILNATIVDQGSPYISGKKEGFSTHGYEYIPTVLSNSKMASVIFNELNPHYRKRSQCYNRAHIWAYEEQVKRNLKSLKVFLFFTTKYIREYNYPWWFHVSPFVLVDENGVITESVLDYLFMKAPTPMRQWTNHFITPKTECPAVEKYSDYDDHQDESNCYLIKKPMYFWQPLDIEEFDNTGTQKMDFVAAEVNRAYRQGFSERNLP